MSITVEELEILISTNYQKAMKDLEGVKAQIQTLFKNIAAPVAESMKKVETQVSSYAKSYAKTYEDIKKAQQKANDYSTKAMTKINSDMAKNEQKVLQSKAKVNEQLQATAKQRLKMEQDISEAITRMYERENQAKAPVTTQNRVIYSKPSKTATQMLREKSVAVPNAPPAQSTNDFSGQQTQQMSILNKVTAQYYAKLDYIKSILYNVGKQGAKAYSDISNATKNAKAQTEKLGVKMQSTAKQGQMAFAKLGQVILRSFKFLVLYKALRQLFTFISDGIKSAIKAPEVENMFRVAFKGLSEEASKFAESLKKAFGIDIVATKEMLGVFQNMITAMGITTKSASTMSKGMTLLANDIASLHNVDATQASENLQSALSGQGRAVRKYGYVIVDSTIKETAYRLGIAKTGDELTEKQKVFARYMTLLEQSTNAQGDLGRTIFNVANQLRILKTQITASGRAIGTAFIPFIQAALPILNTFFILVERIGTSLAHFTFSLFGKDYNQYIREQQIAVGGLSDMAEAEDELADNADKAKKAVKGSLAGFDQLNKSQQNNDSKKNGVDGPEYGVPDIKMPTGESPFEKMADTWAKKLKEVKDILMNLGLKEVLENFKSFWTAFSGQIAQYDFKTAIQDALLSGFELAMSAINLAQKIIFPIAIALDIPGIFYESLNTVTALFNALSDIVRSITPAIENFVKIGLVPIAEWLGTKIKDALIFLQEQLNKVGTWFTDNTQIFTEFGTALGELVNALWEVLEPILDTAWDVFKSVISGVLDVVLAIAKAIIKTLTPALSGIATWIKTNKKIITTVLTTILALILEILAIKGFKKFFDIVTVGFKTLGTTTVKSFKSMSGALSKFSSAMITFVRANPWLAVITAVLALAVAIGTTLYNEHKKTIAEMEKANYEKAFGGIPISIEAAKSSMQNLVDKYTEIDNKTNEHKSTIQNLKSEYDTTAESIDTAFATLDTGSQNAGTTLQVLSDKLISLSDNLKQQVETDGEYYYSEWSGIFDRTSTLSEARETEILTAMATASTAKATQIQTHEAAIKELQEQLNSEEIGRDSTKYATIQKQLEEHYEALRVISERESARNAGIEMQKQALLAIEIFEGRKKVTEDNYAELLGEIENAEELGKTAALNKQASVREELTANHNLRIEELKKQGASEQDQAKASAEYTQQLTAANAAYRAEIEEIATQATGQKMILAEGLDPTIRKVGEVREEVDLLQAKIKETLSLDKILFSGPGFGEGIAPIIEDVNKYKDALKELGEANPEMFKKNLNGTFSFIADDALTAYKTIDKTIKTSIEATAESVLDFSGVTGKNAAQEFNNGVAEYIQKVADASSGIAKTSLNTMANKLGSKDTPSKEFKKHGKWSDEGYVKGVEENKKPIFTAFSSIFDTLEKYMTDFTGISSATMKSWADDVAKKINAVKSDLSSLATTAPNVNIAIGGTSSIPKLATGGVLRQSSLVNVAEYSGARTNPEIVSPQNIMYETSLTAATTANAPLIQILREFMRLVRDKNSVIELDGYKIGKAVNEHNNSNSYILGQ